MPHTFARILLTTGALLCMVRLAHAQAPQDEVVYIDTDGIGSVRMVTDANGNVVERHDFQPFGLESPAASQSNPLFAGKERDASGMDYSGARYFAAKLGRFTAVDPLGGHPSDPQSWNRYSYARDNPLAFVDPDGREVSLIELVGSIANFCNNIGLYAELRFGTYDGFDAECSTMVHIFVGSGHGSGSDATTVNVDDMGDYRGGVLSGGHAVVARPPTGSKNASETKTLAARAKAMVPTFCGGGGFGYGGLTIEITPKLDFEGLILAEYDSRDGGSHGGLVGLGVGPTVMGFESMRTWNDWQEHSGQIGLIGGKFSAASGKFGKTISAGHFEGGGFASRIDGQLSVGGYIGTPALGGGGYLTLSWHGC